MIIFIAAGGNAYAHFRRQMSGETRLMCMVFMDMKENTNIDEVSGRTL